MTRKFTGITILLLATFVALWMFKPTPEENLTYNFSELPIIENGRVKSWDTFARTSLLFIQGKQSLEYEDKKYEPIEWLLTVITQPEKANQIPVFRLQHPGVFALLNLKKEEGKYHSFSTIEPNLEQLFIQADKISEIEKERRTRYQSAIISLYRQVNIYISIQKAFYNPNSESFKQDLKSFELLSQDSALILSSHMEGQHSLGEKEQLNNLLGSFKQFKQMADFTTVHLVPGLHSTRLEDWKTMGDSALSTMKPAPLSPVSLSYAGYYFY